MYLAVVQYTSPETLVFATSINLVAAMVIGGSASIVGTALGALYFVLVPVLSPGRSTPRAPRSSPAPSCWPCCSCCRPAWPRCPPRRRPAAPPPHRGRRGRAGHPRPRRDGACGAHPGGCLHRSTMTTRKARPMRITHRSGAVLATASIAVLLVTGCTRGESAGGPGSDGTSPGITDDSISIGISSPLSGPTAGPGSCTVAGLAAYIGAKNADGGFEFGDGKTRRSSSPTSTTSTTRPGRCRTSGSWSTTGSSPTSGPWGRRPTRPSCRSRRRSRCRRCCSPPVPGPSPRTRTPTPGPRGCCPPTPPRGGLR